MIEQHLLAGRIEVTLPPVGEPDLPEGGQGPKEEEMEFLRDQGEQKVGKVEKGEWGGGIWGGARGVGGKREEGEEIGGDRGLGR